MTDLTDEQLADLAAKAEAATPGPWTTERMFWKRPPERWWHEVHAGLARDVGDCALSADHRNAEHIAAADPQTVASLVAEVRTLRAVVNACYLNAPSVVLVAEAALGLPRRKAGNRHREDMRRLEGELRAELRGDA